MLPREIVGSFFIGFFASLFIINVLLFWLENEMHFAVFAGICLVSILIAYYLDIRIKKVKENQEKKKFKYCYECGAENHLQAKNCFKCGATL